MKRSKEKWESSIRVKEETEELELTSGGREFHRRHDEGMKEALKGTERKNRQGARAQRSQCYGDCIRIDYLQTLECGRRDREVLGCSRVSRSR